MDRGYGHIATPRRVDGVMKTWAPDKGRAPIPFIVDNRRGHGLEVLFPSPMKAMSFCSHSS